MSRPYCPTCQRPLSACWCHCISPLPHEGQVIIWQHPSEAGHPKGTAALLKQCLTHCTLWVGETATPQNIGVPLDSTLLIYPDVGPSGSAEATPTAPQKKPTQVSKSTLLLLDGTWRKSRKIYHSNPWLASLPKLALHANTSQYRIRKSEAPNQLSTFEAACLALHQQQWLTDDVFATAQETFAAYMAHSEQRNASRRSR